MKMKIIKKNLYFSSRKGFTLVELIVAMSLFIIGIVIIIGTFVRALRTERVITHLMSVNSNTSLVLEQMAREMRTGYSFVVVAGPNSSCALGGGELAFTNAKGNSITYKMQGTEIDRQECALADCSRSSFSPLTAGDISVSQACFLNTQPDPTRDPWRITVTLRTGSLNADLSSNLINLQTTIASRVMPSDIAP